MNETKPKYLSKYYPQDKRCGSNGRLCGNSGLLSEGDAFYGDSAAGKLTTFSESKTFQGDTPTVIDGFCLVDSLSTAQDALFSLASTTFCLTCHFFLCYRF